MTDQQCRRRYAVLRNMVDRKLAATVRVTEPRSLNEACAFVLQSGGKRIRSTLTILACEAVGGSARQALEAASAIEIMHNFTLVHDDIMDNAATRRGQPTVHVRWDISNALLAGDTLLGLAYRTLLRTRSRRSATLLDLFTQGLLVVCQGQGLDHEFERRHDLTVADYFRMIEKKTGRLISLAVDMGGVIGGASKPQRTALRTFGNHLGRAFQLQDDLLDVVADGQEFGKTIGGDITEGKRTYLLLTAAERARGADRDVIDGVLRNGARRGDGPDPDTLTAVTAIYERTGALSNARALIERDTTAALRALQKLPRNRGTAMLRWLSESLLHRSS